METLIHAQSTPYTAGASYLVLNPATEQAVIEVRLSSLADVDRAVKAAHKAFGVWRETPALERSRLLHRAADLFEQRIEHMAELLTLEQGKPLVDSRKELAVTARCIRMYAEEALRNEGAAKFGEAGKTLSMVLRQPIGVVVAIGPNNYPVELLVWKIAPALAVGCTVVVKPPLETPLAAGEMVACFVEAGFPEGCVSQVLGGADVGEALVSHPQVQKIAFTGSTPTGKRISEVAAAQLKSLTLELGGNAPFIVCADADMSAAIAGALRRSYSNAGQICIAVKRILVHRSQYPAFVEGFIAAASKLKVADGLKEPNADMGPLVSGAYRERVHQQVQTLLARGASLRLGGSPLAGPGYFYPPTVFEARVEHLADFDEEVFGPVVIVTPFESDAEALWLANATRYGLAAYCYTRDLQKALWYSTHLESGGVGINVNDVSELSMPFGGWKESGMGRELGAYALENYLVLKHVRLGM